MREVALAGTVRLQPLLQDGILDAPDRFLFRDARIGHPVEVAREQFVLVLRRQVAVVGHTHVVLMRHQVVDVLLQVGART